MKRKYRGISGEKISGAKRPDDQLDVRAARPVARISDAFGFLKRENAPSLSIEEMNRIAVEAWAGKR